MLSTFWIYAVAAVGCVWGTGVHRYALRGDNPLREPFRWPES
jgi:hypothetical protein